MSLALFRHAEAKNDCSFIVGSYLNLYEQQSTFCPNMPIRGLMYFSSIYQGYIAEHGMNLYGTKLLTLPVPRYVVFYNGTDPRPEREKLRLSSAFETAGACLEVTATVLNINHGHNQEIMKQCKTLADYSALIGKIREFQHEGKSLPEAVDAACVYCIEHDILKEFLSKHRSEVTKVLLTEYDAKKQRKMDMRDAREEGRLEGHAEAQEQLFRLMKLMRDAGEGDQILRLADDPEFLEEMLAKYIRK